MTKAKNDLLSSLTPIFARSNIEVDSISYVHQDLNVYNFEVDDFNTYFVGQEQILVHNNNCGPALIKKREGTTDLFDELDVIEYNRAAKSPGDNLTPHHILSRNFMTKFKENHPTLYNDPRFKSFIDNYNGDKALCIMMEETFGVAKNSTRHGNTITYGTKKQNDTYLKLSPKEALEYEISNMRDIYRKAGHYDQVVSKKISDFEAKLIATFPKGFFN